MSDQDFNQCESADEAKKVVKADTEWTEVEANVSDVGQAERSHCPAPGKTHQNEAVQPLEPSAGVAAVTVTTSATNPTVIPAANPADKSPNPLPSSTSPAGGVPFPLSLLHPDEFPIPSTKQAVTADESPTRQRTVSQKYNSEYVNPQVYTLSTDQQGFAAPIDAYRNKLNYQSSRHSSKHSSNQRYQDSWNVNGNAKGNNTVRSVNGPTQDQCVNANEEGVSKQYPVNDIRTQPYAGRPVEDAVIKQRNHYPKDRTYDYLRRTESQKKSNDPGNEYSNSHKNSLQKSVNNPEGSRTDYPYFKPGFEGRTSHISANNSNDSTSQSKKPYGLTKTDSQSVSAEKHYKETQQGNKFGYLEPLYTNNNGFNPNAERLNSSAIDAAAYSKHGSRHSVSNHRDKWVDTSYKGQQVPGKEAFADVAYPAFIPDKKYHDPTTLKDNSYLYNKWNHEYSHEVRSRQGTVVNPSQEQDKNHLDYSKHQDKPYANWYNSSYFYPKGYATDSNCSSKSKYHSRNVQQEFAPKHRNGETSHSRTLDKDSKAFHSGPTLSNNFQSTGVRQPEKQSSPYSNNERIPYSSAAVQKHHASYSDSLVSKTATFAVAVTSSSLTTTHPATTTSYSTDLSANPFSAVYSNTRDSVKLSWSSSNSSTTVTGSNAHHVENTEVPTRGRHSSHSSNGSASSLSQLSQSFPVNSHSGGDTGNSALLPSLSSKEVGRDRDGSCSSNNNRSRSNSRNATPSVAHSSAAVTPTSSCSPTASLSYETSGSLTSLVFSKPSSWTAPSSSSVATQLSSSGGIHRSSPLPVVGSLSSTIPGIQQSSLFGLQQTPSQSSYLSAGSSQVMFGSSLVPTVSFLQPGATGPAVFPGESPFAPPNQDLLRRELDTRFLASHDRSINIPPPPYMRTEMHQHQHQHTHMHQHSPFLPPPLGGPMLPQAAAAAHLYDKFPKLDASFYGRGSIGLPGYPGLSPFLSPSTAVAAAAASATPFGPPGHLAAFQPKANSLIKAKPLKSGRWCAMHVRIAWEIYHHQQKQQQADVQKGAPGSGTSFSTSSKSPSDLLHPSNALFTSMHKPHDLTFSSSLFGVANRLSSIPPRSPYDMSSPHNSFLGPTPAHLGIPSLARPAYPGFGPPAGSFGGLGSLGLAGASLLANKELALASVQDPWSRLHRTPPTFPSPSASSNSSWGGLKAEAERERERLQQKEDQEREKERQKKLSAEKEKRDKEIDKSKDVSREKREQEKQKERDRESRVYHVANNTHMLHNGEISERSRERERVWEPPREKRDHSRSPVKVSSGQKTDSAFDSSNKAKQEIKVKEERKDTEQNEQNKEPSSSSTASSERTKSFELQRSSSSSGSSSSDRSRISGHPGSIPTTERSPMPNFWGPLPSNPMLGMNVSSLAMSEHYRNLELQHLRELDKEQLMQKYSSLSSGAVLTPDRLREMELAQQSTQAAYENAARDADRHIQMERERQMYDRSKLAPPPLRSDMTFVPPLGMPPPTTHSSALFPFSSSFLNNFCGSNLTPNSKTGSPTNLGNGILPPLIPCGPAGSPSNTAITTQTHSGQPVRSSPQPPPPPSSSSSTAVPLLPPTQPPSHHKTCPPLGADRESPRESFPPKEKYDTPLQTGDAESQSR